MDHGHHIRTFHTLRILSQQHEIHFIGFSQNRAGFEHQDRLNDYCKSVHIFSLKYKGWRQAIIGLKNLFSPYPLIAQKYFQHDALETILNTIENHRIELVHFDMLHLSEYRQHLKNIRCILVNHNVESLRLKRWVEVEKKFLLRAFLRYQQKKLENYEKHKCLEFHQCIVVSDHDSTYLTKLCDGGEFVTIPNGVDGNYFNVNGTEVVPDSLVWTGSMSGPYNRDAVEYFITSIWPLIIEKKPECKFTIVGDAPTKRILAAAKKNSNIIVTGYVDDVRPYVASSAVFIAPLRSGSGTKIKVLNAMAQAKAVVTTSVGVEGIAAENHKEIIVADEPYDFANEVLALFDNHQKAKELGLNARKIVEKKYDWQIIEKQLNRIYVPC